MDDIERVRDRLENVQGVEPIVSSLRTIAAGSWRLALRRQRAVERYLLELSDVLRALAAHLAPREADRALLWAPPYAAPQAETPQHPLVLVIASERGLCGSFNDIVLYGASRLIQEREARAGRVEVATLGRQAQLYFRAQGRALALARPLPLTRVSSFDEAHTLAEELLRLLRDGDVDAVDVVYSPYRAASVAPAVAVRWLPLAIAPAGDAAPDLAGPPPGAAEDASAPQPAPEDTARAGFPQAIVAGGAAPWPPPIMEADARSLWPLALRQWAWAALFRWIVESAASEQAARYRAMEAAHGNLTRLVSELTLQYHTARQHAITMEMLDLVGGSGLLRGQDRQAPTGRG